ncbi:hypothetical protein E2C01_022283 [Portunus trituberculatus]|uniref:Uncharacterized protein n=1 Tax=Portunus trituberculatus TaxID=210409 RepID=A0A5B7E780_PORTR|nr:hypothetical protein [Portunus trituberculatus]
MPSHWCQAQHRPHRPGTAAIGGGHVSLARPTVQCQVWAVGSSGGDVPDVTRSGTKGQLGLPTPCLRPPDHAASVPTPVRSPRQAPLLTLAMAFL